MDQLSAGLSKRPLPSGSVAALGEKLGTPTFDYRAIEAIAAIIQPSHAEKADLPPGGLAANLLNLSEFLIGEQKERLKAIVTQEYGKLPSVVEKQREWSAAVRELGIGSGTAEISNEVLTYYLNIYIYHNAEHMLTVAHDAARFASTIADELELTGERRQKLVLRAALSGIYHDTGNGRFPREQIGVDELDALRSFLRDRSACGDNSKLAALRGLSLEDTVQIGANIIATVFVDRYASGPMIARRAYLNETLSILREHGLHVTEEDLLRRIQSDEANSIRNADIAIAITRGNFIKSTFSVYFENVLKSKMFYGKSFGDSRRGFINLLRGRFQAAFHGAETDLSAEAAGGNLLINPGGKFKLFMELNKKAAESDRELLLTLANDREICEGMCRLIETNVRRGVFDILSRPMSTIADDLRAMLGTREFEPYEAGFRKYGNEPLMGLSQAAVNELFQVKTKDVCAVAERAKADPRASVRELARIFDDVRPESWQAHYFIELMRFAESHPTEHFLKMLVATPEDEAFVRKGDLSTHAYVVCGGAGVIHATVGDKVVNVIAPANIAGEMSVLLGQRTADLRAVNGPVELMRVSEEATAVVSNSPRLHKLLSQGVALRLANGQVVTALDDQELQRFLRKLFAVNIFNDDPNYPAKYQTELLGQEIEGVAAERGWQKRVFKRGESLTKIGEVPADLYIISKGLVAVDPADGEAPVTAGAGSIIGETAMVSAQHRVTANVTASSDEVSVVCVPNELIAKCEKALQLLSTRR